MATKTITPPAVEPIDRLEEKIKLLVSSIGRLRAEQSRVIEDNARLQREVENLKMRVAEAEGTTSELMDLRGEREQIRTRVSEMLQQLDALNL